VFATRVVEAIELTGRSN